ncbi:hypothetical protein PTSG_02368 [Salpingoeca rosetta]|uniref:SRP54-type proteins GTP-binding domain-containing protein n=1 Tax=Salpingoeca rosetta (strain ATCC 50818 / BSB-021) TaxID=946362 RepID=F2U200_SALR5|nr:uncharacterized protein PTSG_02368 [Salpingoeca rosetta]EGD81652.1 hypothetical protein PTSG_02368 [Salpingoeca rosetta]|eukprot:XP_004996856.1 hypothetical protein PTSG_02368 [Salpingoeca rosetta]
MLDLFTIFTQGGLVLWCFQGPGFLSGDPINGFIQDVLVEGRGATADSYTVQNYNIKYRIDANNNLVFAAVYNKSVESESGYIDNLLNVVKKDFVTRFQDELQQGTITGLDYTNVFQKALGKAQQDYAEETSRGMRTFEETERFAHTAKGSNLTRKAREQLRKERQQARGGSHGEDELSSGEGDDDDGSSGGDEDTTTGGDATKTGSGNGPAVSAEEQRRRRALALKNKGVRGRRSGGGKKPRSAAQQPSSSSSSSPANPPPRSRVSTRVEPTKHTQLSYCDPDDRPEAADAISADDIAEAKRQAARMAEGVQDVDFGFDADEELLGQEDGDDDGNAANASASTTTGSLFTLFRKITGTSEMTKENVQPILDQMQQHLMAKNVAADVAAKLCASVGEKLVGRTKGTFTTIKSVVKQALEESLTQILSPKRQIDILRDVRAAQQEGRPFSMVFCGVNGVGKSTNLSKIAFWLLSNNMRVMIAACDTFRSGAVEQLRTHCRKLRTMLDDTDDAHPRVVVYDRGYGRNDAEVAADAIRIAKSEKYDVVLIDTAGRMQDNAPLMRSLTQLIRTNKPDLVLFVGEALVGNEAVDQLTKFNRALQDYSEERNPRVIDGILLTKFDTVDDKVGSSISMTYITGQPIVFVGTGQHYFDLRKLNVKSVVSALLKPVQK